MPCRSEPASPVSERKRASNNLRKYAASLRSKILSTKTDRGQLERILVFVLQSINDIQRNRKTCGHFGLC